MLAILDISNRVAKKGLDIQTSVKDVFSSGSSRDYLMLCNEGSVSITYKKKINFWLVIISLFFKYAFIQMLQKIAKLIVEPNAHHFMELGRYIWENPDHLEKMLKSFF